MTYLLVCIPISAIVAIYLYRFSNRPMDREAGIVNYRSALWDNALETIEGTSYLWLNKSKWVDAIFESVSGTRTPCISRSDRKRILKESEVKLKDFIRRTLAEKREAIQWKVSDQK